MRLIHREKQVGGGADDISAGFAGEELKAGFAELVHVAFGWFPKAARADAGIEGDFDAVHVVGSLRFEGGGNGNNAPANIGITEEEPGKDMRLEFVLAGLARKDNYKGEAAMVGDGVFDGLGDLALVGTEGFTAGGSPTDGAMADGGTDFLGED